MNNAQHTPPLDRYQRENAIRLVDGYFLPSPCKPGGAQVEFERAKAECAAQLRKQTAQIESLTWEQFNARAAIAAARGQA